MEFAYVLDALTIIISLGGSYLLSRQRDRKFKDDKSLRDDGKHAHVFDHVYRDGKWRCGVLTDKGLCNVVKDFE